jgi:hypothetical protein
MITWDFGLFQIPCFSGCQAPYCYIGPPEFFIEIYDAEDYSGAIRCKEFSSVSIVYDFRTGKYFWFTAHNFSVKIQGFFPGS